MTGPKALGAPAGPAPGARTWGAALVLAALVLGFAACANPVPPSGGPRDTTPPTLVRSSPAAGSVNVATSTRSIRLQFSEFVERSSLPRALTVTPVFERPLRFDWDGRAVEVELPASLRDTTTYIVTLDATLTDARGVEIEEPITVAFSTGPTIDQGELGGRVVDPADGAPQQTVDVYAYDAAAGVPSPLPERPAYRTQTGEDGTFAFDHLREQPYYVVAVRDDNRNRQVDPLEPFAVPPRRAIRADSGAAAVPVPWLVATADTVAPELQRVDAPSRARLELRFSEPVRVQTRTPADWRLRDSARARDVPVRSVYARAEAPQQVVLRTAPMEEGRHRLVVPAGAVADTTGRPVARDTARFQPAARPDTTRTRFQTFTPPALQPDSTGARPLLPGVSPGVRFTQAPDSTQLLRAVSASDTTGRPRAFVLVTTDGTTYRLQFDPPLQAGQRAEVRVDNRALAGPDTTYEHRYRRVTPRALGGLEGRVVLADTSRPPPPASRPGGPPADTLAARPAPLAPPADTAAARADSMARKDAAPRAGRAARAGPAAAADSAGRAAVRDSLLQGNIVVELYAVESRPPVGRRSLQVLPDSAFVFEDLPDGRYRFRAFLDRNGNGRWDPGQVAPYEPAEPVAWSAQPVESRPRWTNALSAPLRIPVLVPAPPPGRADTTRADAPGSGGPDASPTDTSSTGRQRP